jgi:hypothetical protein
MNRRVISLLLVAFVTLSSVGGMAAAAGGFDLNPDAEQYPATQITEDTLDVAAHDRAEMDLLEYENDSGEIQQIDAHINGTDQGELVSYRADQVEVSEFSEYPRKDDEENNSASWADASEWTTSGGATISETDGDTAGGVESVQISTNGSMTSGDVAYVSYSNQSIDTDALKRIIQVVGNVDSLDSGAVVEVQVRDGDGDYVAPEINSSRDGTADDVVANQTADGVIYQHRTGDLTVEGTGDGSLDAIQEVRIQVTDADANVTLTALNVEKKSEWDFGTTRLADTSTDDTEDYNESTVTERPAGGRIELATLDSLGTWSENAVLHQLRYYNVEYRMQDKPSSVNVTFSSADDYGGYPTLLEITWTREIPTGYDLTHGSLELETEQSMITDRYTRLRYAEGVGDTDLEDISSWVDASGSLGEKGDTVTLDATVQAGSTYKTQISLLLQDDDQDALEATGGAGGFWGGSSGSNPIMNMYNWAVAGIAGLLSMVGIKLKAGS